MKHEKDNEYYTIKFDYNDWLKASPKGKGSLEQQVTAKYVQKNKLDPELVKYHIDQLELDKIRRHQKENLDRASDIFFMGLKSEFKRKLKNWKDLGFSVSERYRRVQEELSFTRKKLIDPDVDRKGDLNVAERMEPIFGFNFIEREKMEKYQSTHPLESDEHYWSLINDSAQTTFDEITPSWNNPDHSLTRYFGWRKYKTYLELGIKRTQTRVLEKQSKNHAGSKLKEAEELIDLSPYLHYLRQVKPPVIDSLNRYILTGYKKGAIKAWIQVLKERGHITMISDTQMASSIMKCIENVVIDPGYFRKPDSKIYNQYKLDFHAIIEKKEVASNNP